MGAIQSVLWGNTIPPEPEGMKMLKVKLNLAEIRGDKDEIVNISKQMALLYYQAFRKK